MAAGDDLEAWYQAEAPAVRRLLRALGADPWLIDDLTQETFVEALVGLAGYRGTGSVRAWLCGIALRRFQRDRVRRARQAFALERSARRSPAVAASDLPGDAIRLLAGLEPGDRAVVWLRTVEDWPYADIALALGVTENAARVRHFRAITRLRRSLAPPPLPPTNGS